MKQTLRLLSLLVWVGCQQGRYLPPPAATGPVVATIEVRAPARGPLYAALKHDERIFARGAAAQSGSLELRALSPDAPIPDGPYELWVVLDRDGMPACHPGFGDWYLRQPWSPGQPVTAAWQKRQLSRRDNLITIHYHRFDEDYEDVSIWSWDGHKQHEPPENELFEVGRDDYGLIFQLDRAHYGGSDWIGLLPRLGASWDRKDGDDRYWRPTMKNQIYLLGTTSNVHTGRPDTGPRVVAAWLDAADRAVVQVSKLLGTAEAPVTVRDETGAEWPVASARLVLEKRREKSNYLEITMARPFDIRRHTYTLTVAGFAGQVTPVPRGLLDDPNLFCDRAAVLGAIYTRTGTTFRVFAPTARAVEVVLYDEPTGPRGRVAHPLQRADKGLWETTVAGDLEGKFYVYRLEGQDLSADREALDIYAVNAVANSTRGRITDLGPPVGPGPRVASPVDMVIYEMHVRDFSIAANSGMRHKGKYLAFTEAGTRLPDDPTLATGLDHLVELGVTHVQLLPVQDFENDERSDSYNWGYVTTAYNSPEGWYASDPNNDSRVREFKQLVTALHARGIGVILDVVYNHTANGAAFGQLVPRYYYRFLPDGQYANGSGCGNEFRSEAPMARKYIVDTLKHWVTEYGVDGFRFDLMALIDLETMKEVERELRQVRPDIVLYGEPWAAGPSPMKGPQTTKDTIRGTRIGAFNDHFRNALKGSPFDKSPGFIQAGGETKALRRSLEGSWRDWTDGPHQSLNYLTCHDNYVLYDKLQLSKPDATAAELLDMIKLGYLLLFTAQGVPFLHGGEEFARTKGGHDNSYNAPDSVNQVDWSLKKKHHDLFRYTRDLIALRQAHPAFRLRAKEQIAAWLKFHETNEPDTVLWTIAAENVAGESWKQICVAANAADHLSVELPLPPGRWQVAFDHQGRVTVPLTVEGTVRVRYKSGLILYQD